MNVSTLIEQDEGRRAKLYKDTVGKWTIGIGRNLDGVGLSEDEIDYLFHNDLRKVTDQLATLPFYAKLDEVRQAVLISMCFNLGFAGLKGFVNTLAMIAAGNYQQASAGMLESKWATQVGQRAVRLAAMMRTGQWPTSG